MHVQVAKYSLAIPMIKDGTEHETVDTSIITSSKLFEVKCGYASSESVKFFTMIHQITPSIFSFSECLELFFDFGHFSVDHSDVILLAVSNVDPHKKLIYRFALSLRVLPSEFVALHS